MRVSGRLVATAKMDQQQQYSVDRGRRREMRCLQIRLLLQLVDYFIVFWDRRPSLLGKVRVQRDGGRLSLCFFFSFVRDSGLKMGTST